MHGECGVQGRGISAARMPHIPHREGCLVSLQNTHPITTCNIVQQCFRTALQRRCFVFLRAVPTRGKCDAATASAGPGCLAPPLHIAAPPQTKQDQRDGIAHKMPRSPTPALPLLGLAAEALKGQRCQCWRVRESDQVTDGLGTAEREAVIRGGGIPGSKVSRAGCRNY